MILSKKQADECGQLLDYFSKKGVAYTKGIDPRGGRGDRRRGASRTPAPRGSTRRSRMRGTASTRCAPTAWGIVAILFAMLVMSALAGATYGPVAALLAEMFPPRIRY